MNLEIINISLDLILIGVAVWAVFVIRGLGGIMGKALSFLSWGIIILGIAHFTETILFSLEVFGGLGAEEEAVMNELVHRLLVSAGFILIVLGFKRVSGIRK